MAFSTTPLYLDPSYWQQHPNQEQVLQGSGSRGYHHDQNQHLIPPPPPLPQPHGQSQMGMGGGVGVGQGGSGIRPNSTSERARVANILPPENQLPCPRCDSTNTKFCYYNNYSRTQPRHFCKACRRYWTNGGTLRNVPVGGGFRRNKKSSNKSTSCGGGGGSSSSKSSITTPTTLVGGSGLSLNMDLVSTSGLVPTIPVMPSAGSGTGMSSLMASLQNIAQFRMGNQGLSFGGALNASPLHLGGFGGLTSGTQGECDGGPGGDRKDRHLDFPQVNHSSTNPKVHQEFPNFLGGFQIPGSSNGAGIYTSSPYHNYHGIRGDQSDDNEQGINSLPKNCSSDTNSQYASIKTEGNGQGLNLQKLIINNNNTTGNQMWDGNNGNNFSGLGFSSTAIFYENV